MIFRKRDWYCVGKRKFKTLAEAEAFEIGEFQTEMFDIEVPEDVPAEPVIVEFDFEVD